MKSKKTTRRALLSSIMALILCCAMLVGSTFAWFTDSVTSTNNIIKSGNLDVTLDYYDETEKTFKPVETTTKVFDDSALWEPGYTQVAYLKIGNAGTLALKYQLTANVVEEIAGINAAGESFSLSDHLVFKVIEIDEATVGTYTRETAKAAAGSELGLKSYNGDYKVLEKTGDAHYVALVIYMPETVGNEANYGEKAPSIELGVSLFATQKDYENDSFGSDYDEGLKPGYSPVWSLDELEDALTEGGKIALMDNIQLDSAMNVSADVDLDLNGHTVTADGTYALNFTGGTSVIRNGTIQAASESGAKNVNCIWTDGDATLSLYDVNCLTGTSGTQTNFAIWTDGDSQLYIHGGTYNNAAGGAVIYSYGSSDVYIYDGHFYTVGEDPWAMINDYDNGKNTITIYGGTFVNFDPADEYDNKKGDGPGNTESFIAEGYKTVPITQTSGDVWYYVVPKTDSVASTTTELADAVAAGAETVYLQAGTYELKGSQADGLTIVGLGDGVRISNLTNFAGNGNYGAIWQNVNFENVVFTEKVYTMADGAQSTFTGCTFEQGFRGGYSRGVTFEGCTFYANSEGFAMHFEKVYTTVTVTGCIFKTGTIAFGDNGDGMVTFTGCTFSGETTRTEYFDAWASCELTDCVFEKDTEIWLQQWETGETVTLNNTTGATVVQK